jgi:hypothetical protein
MGQTVGEVARQIGRTMSAVLKRARIRQIKLRRSTYKFPTSDTDPQCMKLCYDAAVVGTEVGVSLVR